VSSTYDPDLTYFMVSIKERVGEREYTADMVVEAGNIVEAKEKAERIALGWYEGDPAGDVRISLVRGRGVQYSVRVSGSYIADRRSPGGGPRHPGS